MKLWFSEKSMETLLEVYHAYGDMLMCSDMEMSERVSVLMGDASTGR